MSRWPRRSSTPCMTGCDSRYSRVAYSASEYGVSSSVESRPVCGTPTLTVMSNPAPRDEIGRVEVTSSTEIRGCSRRTAAMAGATKLTPNPSGAATRTVPPSPASSREATSRMRCTTSSMLVALSATRLPSAVSSQPSEPRVRRLAFSDLSSRLCACSPWCGRGRALRRRSPCARFERRPATAAHRRH